MSTTHTRSALLAMGATIAGSTLLLAACTGGQVAPGTLAPLTPQTSAVSTITSTPTNPPPRESTAPTSSEIPPTTAPATTEVTVDDVEAEPAPILLTATTGAPTSPAVPQDPTLDVPAGAGQKTQGGAEDFVRWWMELGTASLISRDNSVLESYSQKSCEDCRSLIARNQEDIDTGESIALNGDSWINVLQANRIDDDHIAFVIVRYIPPLDYLGPDGSVTESFKAEGVLVGLTVTWQDDHWVMGSLQQVLMP